MSVTLHGGRAHLNGVTFYTDKFISKAYREKDEIKVSVKERKMKSHFYDRIPFLRGIMLLIEMLLMNPIPIICICIMSVIMLSVGDEVSGSPQQVSTLRIIEPYILPGLFFVIALVIRSTKIGRYHAAEHMTAKTFSKGIDLTVNNVMKQSRVYESCGTNLVVFMVVTFFLLSLFNLNVWICFILTWSISYEIFCVEEGWIKRVVLPFYWIGGVAQYFLFTSKPTEKEVLVAMASAKELIRRDVKEVKNE
ncbi:DUF1385 domain-containing protein [Paenibacillus polymyxa]|uniref:DUF1385 domain-containing protein n=1 Tax=Paenibacillus polymyxa (strain SC2) TaxID=886882 RepID=E3EJP0_PAEPS|nr:DUF1385 domain-containing protein [Paenibacillus polymyxa]ADO59638.1 hypothetical protein PPSC2_26945 [Paenibacillus polymyxa SC2]WPQ59536.1 DUF1385 domain-containing protein [Paenibacillus polymyxa]